MGFVINSDKKLFMSLEYSYHIVKPLEAFEMKGQFILLILVGFTIFHVECLSSNCSSDFTNVCVVQGYDRFTPGSKPTIIDAKISLDVSPESRQRQTYVEICPSFMYSFSRIFFQIFSTTLPPAPYAKNVVIYQ
jgi:hypothetical protein